MHHLGWSHHHVKESSCQPWHPAWVSKVHATWEYMGADNVFGKPACWVIMSGSYYHLLRGEDLLCGGEHLQLYHNFPSNQPPFPTRRPFQQFIANSSEQLFCIISQIRERLQLTSQHKQPESLLSESYRTFSPHPEAPERKVDRGNRAQLLQIWMFPTGNLHQGFFSKQYGFNRTLLKEIIRM